MQGVFHVWLLKLSRCGLEKPIPVKSTSYRVISSAVLANISAGVCVCVCTYIYIYIYTSTSVKINICTCACVCRSVVFQHGFDEASKPYLESARSPTTCQSSGAESGNKLLGRLNYV